MGIETANDSVMFIKLIALELASALANNHQVVIDAQRDLAGMDCSEMNAAHDL